MRAAGVNKKLSNARRGQSNSMSIFIKSALLKAAEVKQAVYWATAWFVAILRLMEALYRPKNSSPQLGM
jgi:hydroxymethylpyrimidine/phosphomethylpyrimidine kinase